MRVTVRALDARRARALQDRLAAAGIECVALAGTVDAPAGEDIVIVDASDAGGREIAAHLRQRVTPPLALLAARTSAAPPTEGFAPPEGFDAVFDGALAIDAAPSVLARQLERAERTGIAKAELALRRRTAEALRRAPLRAGAERRLKILYIGAPHQFFLSLERWTSGHGGMLSAAFSSFSGFDHLHDEAFDALVLNAIADPAMALSISSALRRNAGLHHLPTALIVDPADAATAETAHERGASVLFREPGEERASFAWLFEAIRMERTRSAAERGLLALRDLMGDPRTGLFTPDAFSAHVEGLAAAHHDAGRALAVIALHVMPAFGARQPEPAAWEKGVTEIASITARLTRSADCAARVETDTIVAALPGADLDGARRTAERIAAVADCTAFSAGDGSGGPCVIAQSVAQLQPGESGAGLVRRVCAAFDSEVRRA